jgi:hypothetical protein
VALCNHYTPVLSMTSRDAREPHAPCDGVRCGQARGWPCLSPLQEALAPMGGVAWPVLANGNCAFSTMAVWDARCLRGSAIQELRNEIAEFLWAQRHEPAWAAVLRNLGEEESARPRVDVPPLLPAPVDQPEQDVAPGPAGVAAAGPPAREDGVEDPRAAALAAPLAGEPGMLDPDVAAAIARMFGLDVKVDGYTIERIYDKAGGQDVIPTLESVRASDQSASPQLDHKRKLGWRPRTSLPARTRDDFGRGFRAYLLTFGVKDSDREFRGAARAYWKQREESGGLEATEQIVRLLRRCRAASVKFDSTAPVFATAGRLVKHVGIAGRPFMAPSLRDDLFKWFCSIRGSVRGRIPLSLLAAEAVECRIRYLAHCLRWGIPARAPDVRRPAWLKDFRKERRAN